MISCRFSDSCTCDPGPFRLPAGQLDGLGRAGSVEFVEISSILIENRAGTQTSTVVPSPGSEWMTRRDPIRWARSVMPGRPIEADRTPLDRSGAIESHPVVLDQQPQAAGFEVHADGHPSGGGMTLHIGQRLLGDAEQGQLHGRGQSPSPIPVTPNDVANRCRSPASETIWLIDATRPRSSRIDGRRPLAIERSSATVSSTMIRSPASDAESRPVSAWPRSSPGPRSPALRRSDDTGG